MQPREAPELPFQERRILTVSGLNREARQLVEGGLGTVWVEGEISNLARPSSGHLYWSLKDAQAQVRCAMFRMSARGIGFELANGRQVLVRARASVYEARGEYQLIVEYVEEAGEGALRRQFEELKRKLAAEGLFDAARKARAAEAAAAHRRRHLADRRGPARRADRAAAPFPGHRRADLPHGRAGRGRRRRRSRARWRWPTGAPSATC